MKKHLKYLRYIVRHKWFVFVECCRLGIPWRGLVHDLSKLSPAEWGPYVEYFYGRPFPDKDWHGDIRNHIRYEWTESGVKEAFDRAWLHHQHHNPHHWQYWILREDDGGVIRLEMPMKYLKEMLADWRGAGKALGKPDTKAWYLANKDRMCLAPETRKWIAENI